MESLKIIANNLVKLALDFLAAYGLLSIFYGYYVTYTGNSWEPLELLIPFLGFVLTLLATATTTASIYLKPNVQKPKLMSRWVNAPIIILMILGIAIEAIITIRYPSGAVIAGVALIGLSGAMHRIIPSQSERT